MELEKLQPTILNLKAQYENRNAEIRKAQQHLAKKVKETTIMRDLIERQKVEVIELQNSLTNYKSEIEKMQHNLELQQVHEEKLQLMAKERTQAAENLSKEWQEKYFALHQNWQEIKAERAELQKMKKKYEQISSSYSSVKNFLSKTFEIPNPPPAEEPGEAKELDDELFEI